MIAIDGSGVATIDAGAGSEALRVDFARTGSGWTAIVGLPEWLTRGRRSLEVGVVRTDPRGVRTAWPRPMMAGQREVPRLRIDLTRWSSLGER